jgi:hypothetical protein
MCQGSSRDGKWSQRPRATIRACRERLPQVQPEHSTMGRNVPSWDNWGPPYPTHDEDDVVAGTLPFPRPADRAPPLGPLRGDDGTRGA